jgi:hypothetical protein
MEDATRGLAVADTQTPPASVGQQSSAQRTDALAAAPHSSTTGTVRGN